MPNKTITKFSAFVIFIAFACAVSSACHQASSNGRANMNTDYSKSPFEAPKVVGTIESKEINESSGIAVSKCQADVLWTHNDSEGGDFFFAINTKGEKLGTWKIAGAKTVDMEDIAAFKTKEGECFIYIGDIGNNSRKRGELTIFRVKEPVVSKADASSSKKEPLDSGAVETLNFSYPDFRHDAETLLVHPSSGDIYVLTKRITGASGVYKIKPNFGTRNEIQAEKIADLGVPSIPNGFLTGGDISANGRHVIVCDYFAAYELDLPSDAEDFDAIWKAVPTRVDLGSREQGEAVSYGNDDNTVYATSEKRNSPVIRLERRK